MPVIKLSHEGQAVRRRRVLINGGPNMRKTTAALTAPKPIGILSFPGEKGYDTIPVGDPEILPFIWQAAEDGKRVDSSRIVQEVQQVSMDLITGKHGPITTFVGDGLHKFFEYLMDDVTDGAWFDGVEFEPRLYAVGYRKLEDYMSRVMHTQVPVVIFTAWDDDTPDRKKKAGEKGVDVPTSVRPDLPGQMAKRILGEFSVVFHQSLRSPRPGEPEIGVWQTSPGGGVRGAQIKAPQEIVKRIPQFIKADYPTFEALWTKAEVEAKGTT